MKCSEIRDKFIDYMDNNLDINEMSKIKLHIENCTDCKKEYEEIAEAVGYMKNGFDNINTPENFMVNVKANIKKPVNYPGRTRKSLKIVFIAAVLSIIFTITALAGGFDFAKWFQELSIKESKSIEELITNGYGENVNISAQDKDIKITIEKVVADETGTIFTYSIEDLNKKRDYMLYDYTKCLKIEGEFIYPFEGCDIPLKGDSMLYSDIPYIHRGMFRLDPVKFENTTINITIGKVQYGDKMPLSNVEGNWKLSVPVTKYKSIKYVLNKEVDIDGNKVLFKEINIAPTNTSLTLIYDKSQGKGYSISAFAGIKLISNGKEYKSKYMGNNSYKSDSKGSEEVTLEFDSMYLDNPQKIKINVGSYIVDVYKYASYDIDIEKPFPQVFEYFGSKIYMENMNIGEEKTEFTMSYIFGENQYESLNIEFKVKGHPFAGNPYYGDQLEYYTIDRKGNKIELGKSDEPLEKIKPKMYITKQQIIIKDYPGIEKTPPEYHNGKIIPIKLMVMGYKETRYINESFTIKLDKEL